MSDWIEIKTRPLTEEELNYYQEIGVNTEAIGLIFDCLLPDDGQEVIITTAHGNVCTTTFTDNYPDGSWFEYFEGPDDVRAWMPMPEPFKGGADENT